MCSRTDFEKARKVLMKVKPPTRWTKEISPLEANFEFRRLSLVDTVNLNRTRFTQLEDSIDALKNVIKTMNWGPSITRFTAQGSWAHKTIIKPLPGDPFDADLLVYVAPVGGWGSKGLH